MPLSVVGLPLAVWIPAAYAELGIPLGLIGTIFLVSRLSDAITDPMIGIASDRTRTRMGRRKPFMLAGIPLFMLSVYMVFVPPAEPSGLYLLVWISLLFLAATIMDLPYLAWGRGDLPRLLRAYARCRHSGAVPLRRHAHDYQRSTHRKDVLCGHRTDGLSGVDWQDLPRDAPADGRGSGAVRSGTSTANDHEIGALAAGTLDDHRPQRPLQAPAVLLHHQHLRLGHDGRAVVPVRQARADGRGSVSPSTCWSTT